MIDVSPTKKPRAKGVKLPSWWIERVRKISEGRKEDSGESLGALAIELSEAVGRKPAWDHGAVSRFLDEKVTTAPMAEAFAIVFGIPRPFYSPRSWDEATSMQQVARRYEGDRPNPDQRRRLENMDGASGAAEAEIEDQTGTVRSHNERAGTRGRPGRVARGRS